MTTNNTAPIYWSILSYENWKIYIAAIEERFMFCRITKSIIRRIGNMGYIATSLQATSFGMTKS